MRTTKKNNLDTLILECHKYGTYYTVQTIMGYIDKVLKNTRNMGHTIAFLRIKEKLANTIRQKLLLKDIYKDILEAIKKHNMQSPEVSILKQFIKLLKKKNIY